MRKSKVEGIESVTGMQLFNKSNGLDALPDMTSLGPRQLQPVMDAPLYPSSDIPEGISLSPDTASIRKSLPDAGRCAILIAPFRLLASSPKSTKPLQRGVEVKDVNDVSDEVLYSTVVEMVRRPTCVSDAAYSFVREFFGEFKFSLVGKRVRNNRHVFLHGMTCVL